MTLIQLLIFQFIAHILTDYTFQNDKKATDKNKNGFKSKFLKWHILIMFLTSWLLSFQLKFIFASLLIAITHWLIDGFKPKLNSYKYLGKYSFYIDQIAHLVILFFIVLLHNRIFEIHSYIDFIINTKYLLLFTAFLLTAKTSNIFIKEIFKVWEIKIDTQKDDELLKAGRLIGILERWLILVLIFVGQFTAVGFLIAAKSILRYNTKNENGFNKTEYVLIGTMLSFGIAIVIGFLVSNYKN